MLPQQLYSFCMLQLAIIIHSRSNALRKRIMARRRLLLDMMCQFRRMQRRRFSEYTRLPTAEIFEMYMNAIRINRTIWMKSRSNHFWNNIVLCSYTNIEWIESFRMSKQTFYDLCFLLRPRLEPKPLLLKSREPLSVEKQVAVAVYKLANCSEYRVVGNVFSIHKSTVQKCFYRVVNAINDVMMKDYVTMPNIHECSEIAMNFERISNIPQIIGCIDGSHIPILAPSEGYRDFVNRKGWPSYNLQAVVDDKCRFRNIFIRHPGSIMRVFKDSSLYRNVKNIIPQATKNFHGLEIPYLILGDPAYPLMPWLLKGYTGTLTAEQESFNVYLNSARVAIEMAFGRLKGRWRILLKRVDVHYKFVPHIVTCCCILQNFLESKNEQFVQQWLNPVAEAEIMFPQPSVAVREFDDMYGTIVRQHLTDYLCRNFPLRTSLM